MWQLTFPPVTADAIPKIENWCEMQDACSSTQLFHDNVRQTMIVTAWFQSRPEAELPAGAVLEEIPDTHWLHACEQSFPPQSIGPFFLLQDQSRELTCPHGMIPLIINAGAAFGTGEHATTSGCLRALARAAKRHQPQHVLDMGCGSGVLGMAAAARYRARVVAVDNDPVAVRVASENMRKNTLHRLVRCIQADTARHPHIRKYGPYDLIFANILARPLVHMAPALAQALAPSGTLILSGLLSSHTQLVLHAYRQQGLHVHHTSNDHDWMTLTLSSITP